MKMKGLATFTALLLAACAPQAQREGQESSGRNSEATHGGMSMSVDPASPDRSFAAGMITHHRDAVRMAEEQLRLGQDPELRAMAAKIIKDQQGEIDQLERWLAKPEHKGGKQ